MKRMTSELATLAWRHRGTHGVILALVLALVWAAPAAAARPIRSIFYPTGGSHPAGQGCAFDISYVDAPGARITITDFSDGSEAADVHAVVTLTNDATGRTFVHRAFFHDLSWLDGETGVYRDVTSGQVIVWLSPGDLGPNGIVGANGLAVRVVGTVWTSWDPNANAVTEFRYDGTVENVCTLLS